MASGGTIEMSPGDAGKPPGRRGSSFWFDRDTVATTSAGRKGDG